MSCVDDWTAERAITASNDLENHLHLHNDQSINNDSTWRE